MKTETQRKNYQCSSILVIEAEVQQPIASSNVNALQINPWEPEPRYGTIEDN